MAVCEVCSKDFGVSGLALDFTRAEEASPWWLRQRVVHYFCSNVCLDSLYPWERRAAELAQPIPAVLGI